MIGSRLPIALVHADDDDCCDDSNDNGFGIGARVAVIQVGR